MNISFSDAIEHIKTSCYLVGYPTHDEEYRTRKEINKSLDMAIEALNNINKIKKILNEYDGTVVSIIQCFSEIQKLLS